MPSLPIPSISVITVCYNDSAALSRTISSVQEQNFEIQHVIIDGGSTDDTIILLKNSAEKNNSLVYLSEPDKGVYDAINKGVNLTTAEYLLVLNAGDTFASNDVISNIFSSKHFSSQEYLIGRVSYKYLSGQIKKDRLHFPTKANLECSHQAFIYKKSLHKKLGLYNLVYKSASDYDFFSKVYKTYGLLQSEKLPFTIATREKFGGDMSDSLNHTLEMIKIDLAYRFLMNTCIRRSKEIIIKLIRSF